MKGTSKANRFCRFCGAKIPFDSEFCEECGERLSEEGRVVHSLEVLPSKPQGNLKARKTLRVILVFVTVVGLLVAAFAFAARQSAYPQLVITGVNLSMPLLGISVTGSATVQIQGGGALHIQEVTAWLGNKTLRTDYHANEDSLPTQLKVNVYGPADIAATFGVRVRGVWHVNYMIFPTSTTVDISAQTFVEWNLTNGT